MEAVPIDPNRLRPLEGSKQGVQAGAGSDGPGFKEMFSNYLDQVNSLQQEADKSVRDLVTGKMDNMHELIAAISEADLSFRLMMQIRNRLVEAYKEIMRMQV